MRRYRDWNGRFTIKHRGAPNKWIIKLHSGTKLLVDYDDTGDLLDALCVIASARFEQLSHIQASYEDQDA